MVMMATKTIDGEIKKRLPSDEISNRKDIVDRQGRLLATNISKYFSISNSGKTILSRTINPFQDFWFKFFFKYVYNFS